MKVAACVFVVNEDGKILGVSRKDDPNKWGLPGGKSEPNESPEDTAVREAKEETGLDVYDLELIFIRDVPGLDDYRTYTFSAQYKKEQKIGSTSEEETGRVRWLTEEELLAGPFAAYNRRLLNHIKWQDKEW